MLEPRGTIHNVTLLNRSNIKKRRRQQRNMNNNHINHLQGDNDDVTATVSAEQQQQQQQQYEQCFYEEPDYPIHPALEFEIQTTEVRELLLQQQQHQHHHHHHRERQQQFQNHLLLLSSSSSLTSSKTSLCSTLQYLHNDVDMSPPNDYLLIQQHPGHNPIDSIINDNCHGDNDTPLLIPHTSNSSSTDIISPMQDRHGVSGWSFSYFISLVTLVVSGIGIIITLKLQAIPMYNYPNFLNIYSNLLYIPFCYAFNNYTIIVPIRRWMTGENNNVTTTTDTQTSTTLTSASDGIETTEASSPTSSPQEAAGRMKWPSNLLLGKMIVIGILDGITSTLQTFAAVYIPGPLLVLVPQAAIPVSIVLTCCFHNNDRSIYNGSNNNHAMFTMQWLGGMIVLIGIIIVLEPIWSNQHAPDFYCEATDPYNDCTICKIANTEIECLGATSKTFQRNATDTTLAVSQLLFDTSSTDDIHPNQPQIPCQWIPFDESKKEKESLEVIWSILLMLSTLPMAISAIYKQRVMHYLTSPSTLSDDPTNSSPLVPVVVEASSRCSSVLYLSGWIAVFQLITSLMLALPAGMISSPSIQPWNVPENLLNGLFCYAGYPIIANGCHPDTMCTSYHVAVWVNVGVLCHMVYTVSVMVVLQGSDSCIPLFLALTTTVPLGHLAFTLPFLPLSTQSNLHAFDLVGLVVIVTGLAIFRFSNISIATCLMSKRNQSGSIETPNTDGESVVVDGGMKFLPHQIQTSISSLWTQVSNQTSYTLLREPLDQ